MLEYSVDFDRRPLLVLSLHVRHGVPDFGRKTRRKRIKAPSTEVFKYKALWIVFISKRAIEPISAKETKVPFVVILVGSHLNSRQVGHLFCITRCVYKWTWLWIRLGMIQDVSSMTDTAALGVMNINIIPTSERSCNGYSLVLGIGPFMFFLRFQCLPKREEIGSAIVSIMHTHMIDIILCCWLQDFVAVRAPRILHLAI